MNSDAARWYTAEEIAALGLPGYPQSGRRVRDRATVEGWKYREVKSAGRIGRRREYQPPPEVLVLIEARQRGEVPAVLQRKPVQWTDEQRAQFLSDKVGMAQAGERAGALAARVEESIPVAESAIRIALAAERTEWMRRLDDETRARVALGAYRVVALMSEGDDRQLQRWTGSPEALRGALRMAYESDCFKRGIEPGSDMLPLPPISID